MVLLVFTGDMTPLTCDGCLSVNGFSQPCLPPGTGEMLWTIGGLVAGGPLPEEMRLFAWATRHHLHPGVYLNPTEDTWPANR